MGNNTWNLIQSSKRPIHHLHISHNKLLFFPTILHNLWPDLGLLFVFSFDVFQHMTNRDLTKLRRRRQRQQENSWSKTTTNFLAVPVQLRGEKSTFYCICLSSHPWNNREKVWKDAKSVFRGVLIRVVIVAHSEVHNQSVLLTWLKVINEFIITSWIGIAIGRNCYIP